MITLAIDSSNQELSMALFRGDDCLISKEKVSANKHSVYALPMLEELLLEAGLTAKDVSQIIVANGPGSYTGIRIGLTIAKTMAYALNIPLKPISSLQALTLGRGNDVIALIDGKRNQVFIGHYQFNQPVIEDQMMSYEEAKAYIDQSNALVVGLDVITGLETEMIVGTIHAKNYMEANDVLKPIENVHSATPNYIKKTQAELDLFK